jgi:hypothetical protein
MCKDRVAYREMFRAILISVSHGWAKDTTRYQQGFELKLQQDILELTDQSQVDFQPVQFIY